MTKNQLT